MEHPRLSGLAPPSPRFLICVPRSALGALTLGRQTSAVPPGFLDLLLFLLHQSDGLLHSGGFAYQLGAGQPRPEICYIVFLVTPPGEGSDSGPCELFVDLLSRLVDVVFGVCCEVASALYDLLCDFSHVVVFEAGLRFDVFQVEAESAFQNEGRGIGTLIRMDS